MAITRLELTNFRSYDKARFDLSPDVTLVVGPNASGKTNLLESLYVLASTKSFRARDRDLIRHDQNFFRVVASSGSDEITLGITTEAGPLEKRATHDGTRRSLIDHVGKIQVTLFEPTDLDLVSGPPEGRRRYLDFLLSQTDRSYLKTLQMYKRTLKQRNALLEGFEIGRLREEIFVWDVKLAELAAHIYEQRIHLIDTLNASLPHLYGDIAGSSEPISIEYVATVPTGHYSDSFLAALTQNLPRDLAAGFTTIGPHREDFKVHFKNNDITAVASRGETRTVVLACKLAELEYAERATGVRPILLLDDVFSELDRSRRTYLIDRLDGYQTIITTTDADAITKDIKTPHIIINTEVGAHA